MPEITPAPRAGTWLKVTPGATFTPQPRAGTWLQVVPGWPVRGGIYVDGAVHF